MPRDAGVAAHLHTLADALLGWALAACLRLFGILSPDFLHGLMREGWHLVAMIRLVRHRQTKGAGTDRPCLRLRDACSLLYLEFAIPSNSGASPNLSL